jgi:hypothetical protein
MPAHHDLKPCGHGIEIQMVKVMQDVNGRRPHLSHRRRWQLFAPFPRIDVPSHRDDRRKFAQRIEYLGLPDIARVDDDLHPVQRAQSLVAQQPVCV